MHDRCTFEHLYCDPVANIIVVPHFACFVAAGVPISAVDRLRAPSKVRHMIVDLVGVSVVAVWKVEGVGEKRLRDQLMNSALVRSAQSNLQVPIPVSL